MLAVDRSRYSRGFWSEAWFRFRRQKLSMLALAFIIFMAFVAVFSPAIVGTKPLVCKYKGHIYFPCLGYFNPKWEQSILAFRDDNMRGWYAKNLKANDPDSWAIYPLVFQDPYNRVRDDEWPGRA